MRNWYNTVPKTECEVTDTNMIQIGAVINSAVTPSRDFLVALERAVMDRKEKGSRLTLKFFLGSATTTPRNLEEFLATGVDVLIFCGLPRPVLFRCLKAQREHPPLVFCTYSPVSEGEFSILGRCAVVMRDNAVIGRRAAEYFLSHGLRNFAFIGRKGYREDVAGVIREQAFRERLKKDFGGNVSYSSRFIGSFGNNENFWETDQVETEEWITSLPTPCAIFVNGDHLAFRIANSCRHLGINVPERIEILSVNHNCGFGEHAIPSISSINPSFGAFADKALELALGLVADPAAGFGREVVVVDDCDFQERGSTSFGRGYGQVAVRAREFISGNVTRGITVADVAKAVGVSLRTLEFRVKEATGMSVRRFIIEERMSRVCELLSKTKLPVTQVIEAAGCPIASSVFAQFKKRYGVTMGAYRKKGGMADGRRTV